MDVTVTETRVLGDIAYAWGTYTVTFTSKADGTSWPLLGTYLTLWQRQADGAWKVYRDIFEIGLHAVE